MAKVALGLGCVALLLAIVPWLGLVVSLAALVVSLLSWRRSARGEAVLDADGESKQPGLGMSQFATGLAVIMVCITAVWSMVATVVPKQAPPNVDCGKPNLTPAEQIQCQQVAP